jgi:hypothetical protein
MEPTGFKGTRKLWGACQVVRGWQMTALGLLRRVEILHECLNGNRVRIAMFMRWKEWAAPVSWLGVPSEHV